MPFLQQQDQQAVRKRFELELKRDVNLTLFTQRNLGGLFIPGRECRTCGPAQQLLEEVATLSDRLRLEVVDFYTDADRAQAHGIERIPALIISGNDRDNVRYYGLPTGYEFATLLDTIIAASSKKSALQLETRRQLKRLKDDVHVQVFVTPT